MSNLKDREDLCHSSLSVTAMNERTGSRTDSGNMRKLGRAQETSKHTWFIFLKHFFFPSELLLTYTSCSIFIKMIPSATAGWDSLAGVWAISVNAYLPSWTWHVGTQAFIDICKSTGSQCNNLLSNDVLGKMLFLHPSWFEKLCSQDHKHLCHLASTILRLWGED